MIVIEETNVFSAYKKAFFALYDSDNLSSDPEFWKEEVALIEISRADPSLKNVNINNFEALFKFNFDYQKFFPYTDQKFVKKELRIWPSEFVKSSRLDELIICLKKDPLNKRILANLWLYKYSDRRKPAPCLTQINFRVKDNLLEMHSHMRANNATFLLFLDMYILQRVQKFVAFKLNREIGKYLHIIDSFHFYKSESEMINKQKKYIEESSYWNEKDNYL